jgi:DNA repair exonuclease SbcCD ATPase subunit
MRYIVPLCKEHAAIESLRLGLKAADDRVSALLRIKHKAYEIQLMMLMGLIDEFNEEIKRFMTILFDDVPVTLHMKIDETLKTQKIRPGVTLCMAVGGTRRTRLSKGQKDRIHLAITLAMSKIWCKFSNCRRFPLLIIDDIMGSLDTASKENCIKLLSNEFTSPGALGVLCVAHRTIEGTFDNIITLTNES